MLRACLLRNVVTRALLPTTQHQDTLLSAVYSFFPRRLATLTHRVYY